MERPPRQNRPQILRRSSPLQLPPQEFQLRLRRRRAARSCVRKGNAPTARGKRTSLPLTLLLRLVVLGLKRICVHRSLPLGKVGLHGPSTEGYGRYEARQNRTRTNGGV